MLTVARQIGLLAALFFPTDEDEDDLPHHESATPKGAIITNHNQPLNMVAVLSAELLVPPECLYLGLVLSWM